MTDDKRAEAAGGGFDAKGDARHAKAARVIPGIMVRAALAGETLSYEDLTAKVNEATGGAFRINGVGARMRDLRKERPTGRGWTIPGKRRKADSQGHTADAFLLDLAGGECDPACPAEDCPTVNRRKCPAVCEGPFRRPLDLTEFGGGAPRGLVRDEASQQTLGDFAAPKGHWQG